MKTIVEPNSKRQKITRHKIGDQQYELRIGKTVVAQAYKSGRSGVDHYPWEWHLLHEMRFVAEGKRETGVTESLREIVDKLEVHIAEYGLESK